MIRVWFPALTALGLVACDARSDGGYDGVPLFSLTGTVQNQLSTTPDDVGLYLVWEGITEPAVVVPLDVHPTFPARFRLDVMEEPDVFGPEDDEPQLINAIGHVIAARPGTTFHNDVDWRDEPGVLGGDPRHTLYYFRQDLPYIGGLHGEQTAGFHVFDVKCISPERREEIRACIAKFPPPPRDSTPIWKECGLYNADLNRLWLERAPGDLSTELTVELMNDPATWEPDPSECI